MAQGLASEKFPELSAESAANYGLNDQEWERVIEGLGRAPNTIEATFFSQIWSEAYAKKSCRSFLKSLYRGDEQVLRKPNSDLRALALNDDLALVTSIYANNREARTNPEYASAAQASLALLGLTRVGATPLLLSSAYRFGSVESISSQIAFSQAETSLSLFLNNCGVPLVDNNLYFHPRFDNSLMTNIFALGYCKQDIFKRFDKASLGAQLLYIGAPTLSEKGIASDEGVNILPRMGDPYFIGQLINAAREIHQANLVLDWVPAVTAGVAPAIFEITSRYEVGLRVDLDAIPTRGTRSLEPTETLTSSTTGRVIALVEKAKYRQLGEVLRQYKIPVKMIGEVIDSEDIELSWHHNLIGLIPYNYLAEKMAERSYQLSKYPPMLKRKVQPKAKTNKAKSKKTSSDEWSVIREMTEDRQYNSLDEIPVPARLQDSWVDLLANPNNSSRAVLLSMFDRGVSLNLVTNPLAKAGLIAAEQYSLAVSLEANSIFTDKDPYLGMIHSIASGVRNLACIGATPFGLITCINAGSPKQYRELSNLAEALRALNDACSEWSIPILTEEVDLGNGSEANPSLLTPAVLIFGKNAYAKIIPSHFQQAGDIVLLVGNFIGQLGCSEYMSYVHKTFVGDVPDIDFEEHRRTCTAIINLVHQGLLQSANAIASGGLAITLTEACVAGERSLGCKVKLDFSASRADQVLFAEDAGLFIISLKPDRLAAVESLLSQSQLKIYGKGEVGGKVVSIQSQTNKPVELALSTVSRIWRGALAEVLTD